MTTYFISDLHLDHANIINLCNRPFNTVWQMNKALVGNWNSRVGKDDVVFVVGDFAMPNRMKLWLSRLNGNVILIQGNHDGHGAPMAFFREFCVVHDPKSAPSWWNGWVIHGHKHNSNLDKYPHINPTAKTINVSVEVVKYAPVSYNELLQEVQSES